MTEDFLMFERQLITKEKKIFKVYKLREKYLDLLMKNVLGEKTLSNQGFALPRIFKPAPWESVSFGGYYVKPTQLVKQVFKHHQEAINNAPMTKLYEILNFI